MTVNIQLNNKPHSNGLHCVFIRITENRKHRFINSEIYVKKSFFNNKAKWGEWVKKSHPNAASLNKELETLLNKYRGVQTITGKDSFFPFAEEFKEQYNSPKHKGTYDIYTAKLAKLKEFAPNLTFKDIDHAFLRRYVTHLKKLGNKTNTIGVDLKKIRAILNQAVREKKLAYQDNPFLDYKILNEHTYKQKLDINELQLIRDVYLKKDSYLWHARNVFLFCLNCMGMRIGAALKLKSNQVNNGNLFYQTDKKGKMKDIALTDEAAEILTHYMNGKYVFPYLEGCESEHEAVKTKTALINKALKAIGKLAGIDKHITTHVARHTLTKLALDAGTDMRDLQGMLGHSTVAITEHYAGDISDKRSNDALKNIFAPIKKK